MKTNNVSFPHPVLGISNDVTGEYLGHLTVALGKEIVSLKAKHELSNPEYAGLIKAGRAKYCVEVHCAKSFFRKAYVSDKPDHDILIPGTFLRDRVEVDFFIHAARHLETLSLQGWHPDYKGKSFSIRKGALLAYGGKATFMAETDWSAAKAVSSFITINVGKDGDECMKIVLSGEPIQILLPKADYDRYYLLRNDPNAARIFHSALVFPALMYALSQIMEDEEQFRENKWCQAILTRRENDEAIAKLDWEKSNVSEIVQTLLKGPFSRTLGAIEEIIAEGKGDE